MSNINSDIDAVLAREEAGSIRPGWKPIQVQVSMGTSDGVTVSKLD